MKKLYQSKKQKKYTQKRIRKQKRLNKNRKPFDLNRRPRTTIYNNNVIEYINRPPINAPSNLCLMKKTEDCIDFFKKLRKENNISKEGKRCFVGISLSDVTEIDYSTTCVLLAIIGDLKSKGIHIRGNFPKDEKCKKDIIDSGLLNSMYDSSGNPYEKSIRSELLFIEKGTKKLTKQDNIRISNTVSKVNEHLTGQRKHCKKLRTILLEICGNSIEWGGTKNRQWLLGIKYEDDRVIFTITDVGKGIIKSLNRKFKAKFNDFFQGKSDDEILKGAFIKKYGSSSQKENRNKGLPAIKNGFDIGLLKNLKVLTNQVILHYDDDNLSKVMNRGKEFQGTLYRWVVTAESLNKG